MSTARERVTDAVQVMCDEAGLRLEHLSGVTVDRQGRAVKVTIWTGDGKRALPQGTGGVRLKTLPAARTEARAWARELGRRGLLLEGSQVGTPPPAPTTGKLRKGGRA